MLESAQMVAQTIEEYETWFIPLDEENSDTDFLVYAPMTGRLFLAGDLHAEWTRRPWSDARRTAFDEMGLLHPRVQPRGLEFSPHGVIIIPTERCSLGCSYCYAASTPSGRSLPLRDATAAIDWIADKAGSDLGITFIGGGEPTLEWELLEASILHAVAEYGDKDLRVLLVTNGTGLTQERVGFLSRFKVQVQVSFDGALNAKQRPSATGRDMTGTVLASIHRLKDANVLTSVHAIVTNARDTRTILDSLMPLGLPVDIRPEFTGGRGQGIADPDEVKRVASIVGTYGLSPSFIDGALDGRSMVMCPARGTGIVVHPNSAITLCSEFADGGDRFPDMTVGKLVDGQVDVDQVRLESAIHKYGRLPARCTECYAKWACLGGCVVHCLESPDIHCSYLREAFKVAALRRLERPRTAQTAGREESK